MGEAGFLLTSLQVSPILRYEHRSGTGLATKDWYALGVGCWPFGYESNLKAFYTRINAAGSSGVNQFNVQWQIFFF